MTLATKSVLAASLIALSGCLPFFGSSEPEPVAAPVTEIDPSCPTLWVFADTTIKTPGEDVPEDWRAFSGIWGKAGWDGYWCHDLYVLEIGNDGVVSLMDVHGPGGKHDGTVFPRVGQINEEGRLTFVADGETREYWVEDGQLHGRRTKPLDRTLKIKMYPKDDA